jgi:hypothetical protein
MALGSLRERDTLKQFDSGSQESFSRVLRAQEGVSETAGKMTKRTSTETEGPGKTLGGGIAAGASTAATGFAIGAAVAPAATAGSAAASGAAAGSGGGPWGAAIGAVVGLAAYMLM